MRYDCRLEVGDFARNSLTDNLHESATGQGCCLVCSSGGEIALEVLLVDVVHLGEVVDVGQKNLHLDNIFIPDSSSLEDFPDVLQGLVCLLRNSPIWKLARLRVDAKGAAQQKTVADAHCLTVWSDGLWGVWSVDDLSHDFVAHSHCRSLFLRLPFQFIADPLSRISLSNQIVYILWGQQRHFLIEFEGI